MGLEREDVVTTAVGDAEYGGRFASAAGALQLVLPGEVVEAPVAEFPVVVQASPRGWCRAAFTLGVCGGCQYQHAEYAEQVRLKLDILRGLLAGAGLADYLRSRRTARLSGAIGTGSGCGLRRRGTGSGGVQPARGRTSFCR